MILDGNMTVHYLDSIYCPIFLETIFIVLVLGLCSLLGPSS